MMMDSASGVAVFWLIIATQLAGVTSVIVARCSERSGGAAVFQRTFFICLLAVGCTTVLSIWLQNPGWWSGGATLSLMAVGATFDCPPGDQASTRYTGIF